LTTDLFGNEEPAWRKPRPAPTRPSWTRVHAKAFRTQLGARCDACVKRLHAEWHAGVPYVPARTAVWCRRLGGTVQYLCQEDAQPLIAQDEIDYPRRSN
jgi:hypothetical protein